MIIMTIVMNAPQLGIIGLYNGISDSGPSEIGTLYNSKDTIQSPNKLHAL